MVQAEDFVYTTRIREHQLDSFGHVNNAVYLQLFEEARWELLSEQGYGLEVIQETQQGPVILEVQMKFKPELRARDEITIHTQMLSYDKKIGVLRQSMFNKNQELCCEATFTFALFDMRARRIVEPTGAWKKALGLEPS